MFLGGHLYIPKPSSRKPNEWRKSYSREEKELFKEIDGVNECRKHCVRIAKAIFKLSSRLSVFRNFTSYLIKTVAYELKDNKEIDWIETNLGKCTIFFLKKIQKHLEEKNLLHTFDKRINLLCNIRHRRQLTEDLKKTLEHEVIFWKCLDF